jgi:hypothetical protein
MAPLFLDESGCKGTAFFELTKYFGVFFVKIYNYWSKRVKISEKSSNFVA